MRVDNDLMFSDSIGCYVPGIYYNPKKEYYSGNYYHFKSRKAPVLCSYIFPDGTVEEEEVKFKIHGRVTPMAPQKSIRIYSKKGFNFKRFTGDSVCLDKMVLRSSYSGWHDLPYKDGLITNICRDLNFNTTPFQPIILYVNNYYWGIHGARARADKDFIQVLSHHKKVEYSNDMGYKTRTKERTSMYDLIQKIKKDSISYEELKTKIDIPGYTEWLVVQLFFQNYDWPKNNTLFYRVEDEYSKWKPILIDMDACIGKPNYNWMKHISKEKYNTDCTVIMKFLFQQKEYQQYFLQTSQQLLKTTLSQEHLIEQLDQTAKIYEPLLKEHYNRWGSLSGMEDYLKAKENCLMFFKERQAVYLKHIREYFSSIH